MQIVPVTVTKYSIVFSSFFLYIFLFLFRFFYIFLRFCFVCLNLYILLLSFWQCTAHASCQWENKFTGISWISFDMHRWTQNKTRRNIILTILSLFSPFCWHFSFSQSGNLNRHMRVHGTNGNNLITWHRQVSRSSNYEVTYSQQYHTAIYSSASAISCAEELQRLHKKTPIYCTKTTS